jgi:hypothetical protein
VCERDATRAADTRCSFDVALPPGGGVAHVRVVYSAEGSISVAREISVSRELPLDVDGVGVAKALADAFERQTTLLDHREASFGHHQALVHIGTMNGTRQNFAEVTVQVKAGREVLTVRLSRAGATAR